MGGQVQIQTQIYKYMRVFDIIRFIKSQRLKWLGHIERMQKEREVTKIYKWKPFASRPIGRRKNRWKDDVRKDLQTMKIKNWKRSVLDRDLWKKIVERTKTHSELQRLLRRRSGLNPPKPPLGTPLPLEGNRSTIHDATFSLVTILSTQSRLSTCVSR